MKCNKCGAKLENDVMFCRECGNKLEKKALFCRECGSKYNEGAKFCPNCGVDIIDISKVKSSINNNASRTKTENSENNNVFSESDTNTNDYINKLSEKWLRLPLTNKIMSIMIAVTAIIMIISLVIRKYIVVAIAAFQLLCMIVLLIKKKSLLSQGKKYVNVTIIGISLILFAVSTTTFFWKKVPRIISIPYSADVYIGKDSKEVITSLKKIGFYNIIEKPIYDKDFHEAVGKIESIDIDGNNAFASNSNFKSTEKVEVSYHTYKKCAIPVCAADLESKSIEDIQGIFEEAGFFNITVEKVYDLNSNSTEPGYKNVVSINGKTNYTTSDEISIDSKIVIENHLPYVEHKVSVHIDFEGNLILSKYDVVMKMNGVEQYTLKHGKNKDCEFSLPPGEYKFTFSEVDKSSVKGEVTLVVDGEINASYHIACHENEVTVTTNYVEHLGAVGENDVMVSTASADYKYENYKNVQEELEQAGFNNILFNIKYDIVYGITEEGSVDSVSIAGNKTFKRGDIFKKDDEVIITYHMKEEDDPGNQVTETKPAETVPTETKPAETVPTETKPVETVPTETKPVDTEIQSAVILPESSTKLGKDFDMQGSSTVYYINVDGTSNKPNLKEWGSATVTDGVAEYLDYLETLGCTVKITDYEKKNPYSGFTLYETYFEVINGTTTWIMYLNIQDEDYVEYELDIYLP